MHLSLPTPSTLDRNSRSRHFRLPQAAADPFEEPTDHAVQESSRIPDDRYTPGIKVDWTRLIDSTATLPLHVTLGEVQQFFRDHGKDSFAAVLDGDRIIGLCSELGISRKLTVSRGLGYHVYAKTTLGRHLEPAFLVIRQGDPVRGVLHRVMSRDEGFFDDIILTGADGRFLGLIHTRTMMQLQHRISQQQVGDLESLTLKLSDNNIELERARDTALRAAEMKSSFLANMSHEIRTPLNGILGMVKILMRTGLDTQQRRYASTVLNSANALLSILNDILDFSKIEAGKMTIEQIPLDIADVVEECVQLLSERAREKKIQIFSWVDLNARTRVVSDPTRLRQVILNLASNAVKFTDKGEIVVRIDQLGETATHVKLKVSVRDSGIGIAPAVRDRLFRPFEQGDHSTNRKFGGTGLGLAICKKIVELIGGTIGCESEPGTGSTFWFVLDLPKQEDAGAGPTRHEDGLWGRRMLIADSSPTFGAYLEQHMERWNVVSRVAADSAAALEAARTQAGRGTPFDVVIVDHALQPLNGLDLAREFQNDPLLAHTRFILLTAFENEQPAEVLQHSGIVGTMAKPLKPSELYDKLAGCVHNHTPATSLVGTVAAPPAAPATERGCRPLHLLLVEDSEVNREVALILLNSWGHTLDTAENGRVAVEMLKTRRYDGILMDCQMPEMDGYEATRWIRNPSSPVLDHGIPIIAMTANAMPGDRDTCLQAGMNDYVGKPVDEGELLRALLRVADHKATPSPTPSPTPAIAVSPIPEPVSVLKPAPVQDSSEGKASAKPKPVDDEPYFPARLMTLFLNETAFRLSSLQEAVQRGDAEMVQRIAHTIKGTAGNFRAHELYEITRDLERGARENQVAQFAPLMAKAMEAFFSVQKKYQPAPPPTPGTETP